MWSRIYKNTNFAAIGINANEQGILIAPTDNTYAANIIASRKGDEESEKNANRF